MTWLETPEFHSLLNPKKIGLAVFELHGHQTGEWGCVTAESMQAGSFGSDLEKLLRHARDNGDSDGYAGKFKVSVIKFEDPGHPRLIALFVDGHQELQMLQTALHLHRHLEVLHRLGKALTMNQSIRPLALSVVHTLQACLNLISAELWVETGGAGGYELLASAGVAKEPGEELVAARESGQTRRSNGGRCAVMPLISNSEILGLLSVEQSPGEDDLDLLDIVREHVALALQSAMMFESVERLATTDPLTGLSNHRTLQAFLKKKVEEAAESQTPLGVVMIDVDHFRKFNEEEGHEGGDAVLVLVAQAMLTAVRNIDLVARYGGEEFTLILPGANSIQTAQIAERVRAAIQEAPFITRSGVKRAVTASLGCAIFPMNAQDANGVLKAADIALYEAKRAGRNRVMIAPDVIYSERLAG